MFAEPRTLHLRVWLPALGFFGLSVNTIAQSTGSFVPTGTMTAPRWGHTATLLPDGKVLISGGASSKRGFALGPYLASAELYDPLTGQFTAAGSMNDARAFHSATLL